MQRGGIALLITLFFIMLITISIGVGLKQVKKASSSVSDEKFLLQTSVILDDALTLLQTSKILQDINSSDDLSAFLAEASFIPLEAVGVKISLELSSARSKFNINSLNSGSIDSNEVRQIQFENFIAKKQITPAFIPILLDSMGGVREDLTYETELFNETPSLFRDFVASKKHFQELQYFYEKTYNDKSINELKYENLLYFGSDNNETYKIDLNFATAEVWELMLGCDTQRAEELAEEVYESFDKMKESDIVSVEEIYLLKNRFNTSFFQPHIYVIVTIIQDEKEAVVSFEYDIQNKKASKFVYEI